MLAARGHQEILARSINLPDSTVCLRSQLRIVLIFALIRSVGALTLGEAPAVLWFGRAGSRRCEWHVWPCFGLCLSEGNCSCFQSLDLRLLLLHLFTKITELLVLVLDLSRRSMSVLAAVRPGPLLHASSLEDVNEVGGLGIFDALRVEELVPLPEEGEVRCH